MQASAVCNLPTPGNYTVSCKLKTELLDYP